MTDHPLLHQPSRRTLLKAGALAAAPLMFAPAAFGQAKPAGERILVVLELSGGNDGHGTLIATDSDSFNAFTQAATPPSSAARCRNVR